MTDPYQEYHKILSETSGGRYTPEEVKQLESGEEEAHLDAIADAAVFEEEKRNADEQGVCVHCYEPKDQCTGYKCWIR